MAPLVAVDVDVKALPDATVYAADIFGALQGFQDVAAEPAAAAAAKATAMYFVSNVDAIAHYPAGDSAASTGLVSQLSASAPIKATNAKHTTAVAFIDCVRGTQWAYGGKQQRRQRSLASEVTVVAQCEFTLSHEQKT
jgi:hypothetical protein